MFAKQLTRAQKAMLKSEVELVNMVRQPVRPRIVTSTVRRPPVTGKVIPRIKKIEKLKKKIIIIRPATGIISPPPVVTSTVAPPAESAQPKTSAQLTTTTPTTGGTAGFSGLPSFPAPAHQASHSKASGDARPWRVFYYDKETPLYFRLGAVRHRQWVGNRRFVLRMNGETGYIRCVSCHEKEKPKKNN